MKDGSNRPDATQLPPSPSGDQSVAALGHRALAEKAEPETKPVCRNWWYPERLDQERTSSIGCGKPPARMWLADLLTCFEPWPLQSLHLPYLLYLIRRRHCAGTPIHCGTLPWALQSRWPAKVANPTTYLMASVSQTFESLLRGGDVGGWFCHTPLASRYFLTGRLELHTKPIATRHLRKIATPPRSTPLLGWHSLPLGY